MKRSDARAKLVALHSAVGRTLADPRARYFDPAVVLELFARWVPIRDALRSEFTSVLGDMPVREAPTSSGTTDHEGRGYVNRQAIEQLHEDMQYALDALAAAATPTYSSVSWLDFNEQQSKFVDRVKWAGVSLFGMSVGLFGVLWQRDPHCIIKNGECSRGGPLVGCVDIKEVVLLGYVIVSVAIVVWASVNWRQLIAKASPGKTPPRMVTWLLYSIVAVVGTVTVWGIVEICETWKEAWFAGTMRCLTSRP